RAHYADNQRAHGRTTQEDSPDYRCNHGNDAQDDHQPECCPGGNIHSTCIVRLRSSLSETWDLSQLPSNLLDHAIRTHSDCVYRSSREDKWKHAANQGTDDDVGTVESKKCPKTRQLGRQSCCYTWVRS